VEIRISTEEAEKIIAKHLIDIGYELEDNVYFKNYEMGVGEFQAFVAMPNEVNHE